MTIEVQDNFDISRAPGEYRQDCPCCDGLGRHTLPCTPFDEPLPCHRCSQTGYVLTEAGHSLLKMIRLANSGIDS